MKENNIPTAEEFLFKDEDKEITTTTVWTDEAITAMIEFAKLHVIEAQKAWFDKIKLEGLVTEAGIAYLENAYSLDNIK